MSDQGTITFVPSVHFSRTHRQRARETIRTVEPDVVAVELDERRFENLQQDRRPNPIELARDLPPPVAVGYTVLRAIQQTVVRLSGLDPTKTDMETAIETAAELDTEVALIDEPMSQTVTALMNRIGPETLPRLLFRTQSLGPEEYARQMEVVATPFSEIDHGDDVQPVIDNMRLLLPEVAGVLIDQRDRAMAERLHRLRCGGYDVVAIIGAGHHNGIRRALEDLEAESADLDVRVPLKQPSREVTQIPID
ncbi:conjugal transfer protein TraB [Natronococcus pandeyae]|uniref:Conjugal transfer protein TraB n=1 Tax=Natronococcus pandeyae TaxID=2055836 RepID=A0A8J8Q153_9EURY|nr:TraB domain-containing protein [Natronococcus pandeyae]TYL36904.1 conjugal transfer protein TraB [Natronococcus pandeyae]